MARVRFCSSSTKHKDSVQFGFFAVTKINSSVLVRF